MRHEDRVPANGRENNRRPKRRFEIQQDVRYKMLYGQRIAETGVGRTLNVSSSGVWITTASSRYFWRQVGQLEQAGRVHSAGTDSERRFGNPARRRGWRQAQHEQPGQERR